MDVTPPTVDREAVIAYAADTLGYEVRRGRQGRAVILAHDEHDPLLGIEDLGAAGLIVHLYQAHPERYQCEGELFARVAEREQEEDAAIAEGPDLRGMAEREMVMEGV